MTKFTMALLGASMLSTPALAQTAPAPGRTPIEAPAEPKAPAVGVTVVDTAGAPVGTIATIDGAVATIDTGTNKVGFPLNSMTPGPNGPIVAVTRAQLDASYAEQVAKGQAMLAEKLVAGTAVRTLNGSVQAGTIKAVDGEFVTLTTGAGRDVRLPKSGFALNAQQDVIIGLTAQQFDAAVRSTTGG